MPHHSEETPQPLAYQKQIATWRNLELIVNPQVLIPRPETSDLIDTIFKLIPKTPSHLVEVGTGSGCISISLAQKWTNTKILALDISLQALEIAHLNINKYNLGSQIELQPSNLLPSTINPKTSLLVANLPYLAAEELNITANTSPADKWRIQALFHEPRQALTDEADGTTLYQKLLLQIKKNHPQIKDVFLEISPPTAPILIKFIEKNLKTSKHQIHQDQFKRQRILQIKF